jgi:PAS domain-containing protein
MFVAKDRPGAGSRNGRDRTIEDTTSAMEGRGPLRPCAEHARGSREAARVELTREIRASEESSRGLIEASFLGVPIATKNHEPLLANRSCARNFGFGAFATDVTGRKRTEGQRTIRLCRDGGERAR